MDRNKVKPLSSFYYFRNRWYDPRVGRFISEDPIGFAASWLQRGSFNLYVYTVNNPIMFSDPYGEDVWLGLVAQISLAIKMGPLAATSPMWNPSTGEVCLVSYSGIKYGSIIDVSLSGELLVVPIGPHCGYQLGGETALLEAGVKWPTGSLSFSGVALGISLGLGGGVTYWGGYSTFVTYVIGCTNTPCECKK